MNGIIKSILLTTFAVIAFMGSNAQANQCVLETWQASASYPAFTFTHYRAANSTADCQNFVNYIVNLHCSEEPGGALHIKARRDYLLMGIGLKSDAIADNVFPCAGSPPGGPVGGSGGGTPQPVELLSLKICLQMLVSPTTVAALSDVTVSNGAVSVRTGPGGCADFKIPRGVYNFTASKGGFSLSGSISNDRNGKISQVLVNTSGQMIRYQEY